MKLLHVLVSIVTAVCWLGIVDTARAVAFDVSCGGAVNIDTNPATIVACNIAEVGTLTDLNVVLNIDENPGTPYSTDLQIGLFHVASGTLVSIFEGLGPNTVSRMDAIFDDSGAGPPPTSGDIIGTFVPVGMLSAFNGLELSGDWEIRFLDPTAFTNEGLDLIEWRLTGAHVPEPGSAMLLSLGLFGLTLLSGRKHEAKPEDSGSASR